MKNVLKILACSLLLVSVSGCGLTIGPVVENKAIIVKPGVVMEVLENKKVKCHVMTEKDGEINVIKQDIGGWLVIPPEHWQSLKKELETARGKK